MKDLSKSLRQFLFVGFKGLSLEELSAVSMTETHVLLKCDLSNEAMIEDDEEDLDAGL